MYKVSLQKLYKIIANIENCITFADETYTKILKQIYMRSTVLVQSKVPLEVKQSSEKILIGLGV